MTAFPSRFWWLCAGSYFFFGSFNMVIPELPELLEPMGEADRKGLVISLFTLTALISRPFSGRLADTIGRVPVMVAGAAVCVCCSLLYPWMSSFAVFVALRLFHGFSTGFSPTGFSAYIADIVPEHRRGEAIGLVTTFGSLGMASSPALGGFLVSRFSHEAMFMASAAFAVLAVLIFHRLPESLADRKSFQLSHLSIRRQDLFEPSIWLPCVIMVLTAFSYGAMLTLLPERSVSAGFSNKGSMFMVFALSSVAVRIFAGRLSDRLGRVRILFAGIIFLIIGVSICSQSLAAVTLVLGCICYGISNGITSPTLFAWATDICPSHHKARAFASLYITLELGIGLGALLSGEISTLSGKISAAFLVCAGLGVLALMALHPRLRHSIAVTWPDMTSRPQSATKISATTRNIFIVLSVLYMAAVPLIPKSVYFIKPLLVPALMVHYIMLPSKTERFMLRALFFCWVGDIFMMFSNDNVYFLAGMLSFLFGHVLFIFSFRRRVWIDTYHGRPELSLMIMAFIIALASYVALLIFPGAGALQIPILIYELVIVSMFFNAIRRRGRTSGSSFILLSVGATLFMISDAILGLNRFYLNSTLAYDWIWVMSTYLSALLLIVEGVSRHPEDRPSVPLTHV